ncbi:MAG TPA: 50S ribosomal protein L15 [Armatimonadota bacterium]|jgi:large subunit ribosomal protein L15
MRLDDLSPAPGSRHKPKRLGRGLGSGTGKTAGRGTKGQHAHGHVRMGFQGGETPFYHRIPHLGGFRNPNREEYWVVNLSQLEKLETGTVVTPDLLADKGLIRDLKQKIKILGDGELSHPLTVRAHKFSKSAVDKIQQAGGTVEAL